MRKKIKSLRYLYSYSGNLELASFKEEQRLDRSDAASQLGAAVVAQEACSGRSDAALR